MKKSFHLIVKQIPHPSLRCTGDVSQKSTENWLNFLISAYAAGTGETWEILS